MADLDVLGGVPVSGVASWILYYWRGQALIKDWRN